MNSTSEQDRQPPIIWKYICAVFAPVELRLIGVREVNDGFNQCSLTARSLHLMYLETVYMMMNDMRSGCKFPSLQSLAIDLCDNWMSEFDEHLEVVSGVLGQVGSGLHNLTLQFGHTRHYASSLSSPSPDGAGTGNIYLHTFLCTEADLALDPWDRVEFYHCTSLRTLHAQVRTRFVFDDEEAITDEPITDEPERLTTGWHYLETVLSQLNAALEALTISVDEIRDDQHLRGQLKTGQWASLQQLILSRFRNLKHVLIMKEEPEGAWGDYVQSHLIPSEKQIVEDTMPLLSAAGLIRFE